MMSTTTIPALVVPTPTRSNFTLRMHVDQKPHRSSSPPGRIQLQARRGSVSAGPDPLGAQSRKDVPPRNSHSRLTLVRVPQPVQSTVNSARHSRQRSAGRNSGPHNGLESPTRLCFSSASFGPRSPRSSTPGSPTFSPNVVSPGRPQSPSSPRQCYGSPSPPSSARQEQLSPSQIYDLAKTSSHPTFKGFAEAAPTPSSFAMLPDDVFLPYVDRPAEVHELIAQRNNARLMMLLAKTIPSSSAADAPSSKSIPELASQPEGWSYEDCMAWLTGVDRIEVTDAEWVKVLRVFVLARSEVLWERVKGMLGIPPELDVEDESCIRLDLSPLSASEPSCDLTINPIHPAAFTPCAIGELDEISESAEDAHSKAADQVLGLSISSSISHPRATPSPSPSRSRASSAPKRSSPLNPNSVSKLPEHEHRPKQSAHTKTAPCPKFPASFAKLGPRPTRLCVH